MRQLPTKVLAAAAVAALALLALFSLAVLGGEWTSFLLGVVGVVILAILLIAIRTLRAQRESMIALAARLEVVATKLDGPLARPAQVLGSQDNQVAENAARFDWIARRQAELIRLIQAQSATEANASSSSAPTDSADDS